MLLATGMSAGNLFPRALVKKALPPRRYGRIVRD